VFALFVVGGIIYFKHFYEAFFLGFLFDALYGTNLIPLHGFRFIFSSAFLGIVVVVNFLKEKVRA
jgi:hypothetical protein